MSSDPQMRIEQARRLSERITDYLSAGGLLNPESMEHDKVRRLLIDCRNAFDALITAAQADRLSRLNKCPDAIAIDVARRVAELPDRTSPADWPDAMLVTSAELQFIVTDAINDALIAAVQADHLGAQWHIGIAGNCNIVVFDGDDITGIAHVPDHKQAERIVAAHNASLTRLASEEPQEGAGPLLKALWAISERMGLHVELSVIDVVDSYEARLVDDNSQPIVSANGKTVEGALMALAHQVAVVPVSSEAPQRDGQPTDVGGSHDGDRE